MRAIPIKPVASGASHKTMAGFKGIGGYALLIIFFAYTFESPIAVDTPVKDSIEF